MSEIAGHAMRRALRKRRVFDFVPSYLNRGQRWIVKRRRSYAFSHRGEHFCLRGGCREEGEIWCGSPQWTTNAQLPKPQAATVAAAQRSKERSAYPNKKGSIEDIASAKAELKLKKGIKLILKTIGNRKGVCVRSCSRWQTPPEKICKWQSTNQCPLRTLYWFVLCKLQISQVVFVTLNNFTHNLLFYFQ